MVSSLFALVALLAQDAFAQTGSARGANFLRFGCSQLSVERIDPLVNPGLIPSAHTHQIVGGNSFNSTMTPVSQDPSTTSSCTSCKLSEDFSNYWTASIYFQSPENGTFKRVPQMANGRLNGTLLEQDGGLTIYYMQPFSGTNLNVTVMSPGFRMLTGDPMLRSQANGSVAICHRCLAANERMTGGSGAPCSSTDTASFPTTPCPGGIRATVIFPSCWDGKNLDSPDNRSHVYYQPGSALAGDACPSSHPVRIPQVMYEIITGYGAHGDYLFGWKAGALQRAMNALGTNCFSETCPVLELQPSSNAINCTKPQQAVEDVGSDTWLKELPGGMKVQ
ncbi:hypothetical protein LSUE1_G003911 [Lachnellula suecica]|uniref:DUF1996 domain-containing protein n=1 Tax=Lachnellula suecica TaxID=602035 RepID=A0A8T9CAQ7_9HELO|nr:hypothetical protein LSUE1_G003911 [Lachnellula suecica]